MKVWYGRLAADHKPLRNCVPARLEAAEVDARRQCRNVKDDVGGARRLGQDKSALPVKEALKDLEKGQFTKILDTEFGYQIFYLQDVMHTGGKPFEQAKVEIEEKLFADIVDQRFQTWLKSLRQRAHVQVLE